MNYLDTNRPYMLFEENINSPIYVDKSLLIEKINKAIRTNGKYICITRPRRFGKSINANMLGAYYSKGTQEFDSHALFDNLAIAKTDSYEKHLNKHHVIYIDFSRLPFQCNSYEDYIASIYKKLRKDIFSRYDIEDEYDSLEDMLAATNDSFIFILDEWDSIFYKDFMSAKDKLSYLEFLKGLLKDQPYVELAYMTGVLPIAKYSSGSALNRHCPPFGVFKEYSFINDHTYEMFFGFHEEEVRELCKKYDSIPYDTIKYWYDGYKLQNGQSLFNPRSVINALTDGVCLNYWTETGPMNEIANCIENNVDAVRDDIVKLVSGIPVGIELEGYGASDLKLNSRDEILSAMVVYGFLSYHDGKLQIPNHELMEKFQQVLERESMGEVAEIVNKSEEMLDATINKDSEAVAKYLKEIRANGPAACAREVPLLKYNDENSLSCVITLCYLKARDYYRITREQHSGEGYVDFLFQPIRDGYPAVVLELHTCARSAKCGHSAEEAIEQIKHTNYVDQVRDCKEILLVGINYDKVTKEHTCIIEESQKR